MKKIPKLQPIPIKQPSWKCQHQLRDALVEFYGLDDEGYLHIDPQGFCEDYGIDYYYFTQWYDFYSPLDLAEVIIWQIDEDIRKKILQDFHIIL